MSNNNKTLTWRVGELEKTIDRLDLKIDKLMSNEVPHLMAELNVIRNDMQKLKTLMTLNIAAIILGILLAKFL